jgi:LytR cell envelope-related transcriptional attenuator
MRIIVDNSQGGDAGFAADVARTLQEAGYEVEVRPPSPRALFDTSVHFVVDGVAVRVPVECGRDQLRTVEQAIQDAESHRSEHRRYRAVPIYAGETARVLEWVDIVET